MTLRAKVLMRLRKEMDIHKLRVRREGEYLVRIMVVSKDFKGMSILARTKKALSAIDYGRIEGEMYLVTVVTFTPRERIMNRTRLIKEGWF